MMHHAVNNRGGDNGIPEVIAEVLPIDICREQCRTFAVTAVDNLEEERGMFGVLLFEAVKA